MSSEPSPLSELGESLQKFSQSVSSLCWQGKRSTCIHAKTVRMTHLDPSLQIRAHFTGAQTVSAASLKGIPVSELRRAAAWSSITTFTKHYSLMEGSKPDACFGRAVLHSLLKYSLSSTHLLTMRSLLVSHQKWNAHGQALREERTVTY